MLKRLFAIAVIGVAGEYLESRIVGAYDQVQRVVIKQRHDKEGVLDLTIEKVWPIRLFVGGADWATAIGLCRFGYLLAEVAAPEMTRIGAHLYDISSHLNKAEGFPIWVPISLPLLGHLKRNGALVQIWIVVLKQHCS